MGAPQGGRYELKESKIGRVFSYLAMKWVDRLSVLVRRPNLPISQQTENSVFEIMRTSDVLEPETTSPLSGAIAFSFSISIVVISLLVEVSDGHFDEGEYQMLWTVEDWDEQDVGPIL